MFLRRYTQSPQYIKYIYLFLSSFRQGCKLPCLIDYLICLLRIYPLMVQLWCTWEINELIQKKCWIKLPPYMGCIGHPNNICTVCTSVASALNQLAEGESSSVFTNHIKKGRYFFPLWTGQRIAFLASYCGYYSGTIRVQIC